MALAAEAANSQGLTFGIVALDWKKAYDGVSLDILQDTVSKAGIPDWGLRPLMHMYKAKRRIRVGNITGEPWEPSCGIMTGFAIAVFA